MIGLRFNRLTVVDIIRKGYKKYCKCICDCGTERIAREDHLKSGGIGSCGCLQKELATERAYKHGCSKNPTYNTWSNMKSRCYNENEPAYERYGGRGITVCDRWLNSFENFLADMGERPEGMCIDRIDNDGNYELDNCRWASYKQNNRNKRNTTLITYLGETRSLSDWSDTLKIPYTTLVNRLINAKWDVERAFTESVCIGKNQFLTQSDLNFKFSSDTDIIFDK